MADIDLARLRRGIEKESLRVRPDGSLALTPHPRALGSALTHPNITTDFSESQLELITGVHDSIAGCLGELTAIHQAVYKAIGEEILWGASMPCGLPPDDRIPIGQYGSSNVGRAKTVYRTGLSWRYGRRMQAISGIHYNFSLPGQRSNEEYFALIRNFRRHCWLLLYLFGASPAVCSSFVEGRQHELQELNKGTFFLPHATTLRMGRLGYQSEAQASLAVSYNSLEGYGASLQPALTKPYPPYTKIGVQVNGEYRQLSDSLLQIENEFYGKIRAKRRIKPGERPLHALRERGVEYVEVRLVDLDPFSAIGITPETIRFFDLFLLHCFFTDSPPDTPDELRCLAYNQNVVAMRGREPGLLLKRDSHEIALAKWGEDLLKQCGPFADALDQAHGGTGHRAALSAAQAALADPALTPSSRVLRVMREEHDNSYTRFALAQSGKHAEYLRSVPYPADLQSRFTRLAEVSIAKQAQVEAADTMPFEQYRQKYLAPERLRA